MGLFCTINIQRALAFVSLVIWLFILSNITDSQSTLYHSFPTDGQEDVSLNPTLEITCPGDGIVAAQYVIASDPIFSSVVYDSGEHINDVCSHVAFADLQKGTVHYWRARVKDNAGGWSDWSHPTSFTTTTAASIFINVFQDGFLGYTGTRDADIRGNGVNPTGPPKREWNQGAQDVIRTGRRPPGKSTDEIYRTLLKFDLSSLTSPGAVINAYLELTGTRHGEKDENLFFHASNSLYEMVRPWGEGQGLTEKILQPGDATWTYAAYPTPWAIRGAGFASDVDPNADRKASPVVRKIVTNQPGYDTVWSSQAFIELVKKWIERPDLNQGILLKADDESLRKPLILASSEHADVTFRPRLVVETTAQLAASINQRPVAGNDTANMDAGTSIDIRVLSNDSDPDGGPAPLSIASVAAPNNGTAQIVGNTVRYSPAAGFVGTETFSYTISDGATTATATITVTVNAVSELPTVTGFTATPSTMATGETSILAWTTAHTNSVSVTPSGGSGLPATGSLGVSPTTTTTYTLTATGSGGTASATVIVTVNAPPAALPMVTNFTASPTVLAVGETTTLQWSTTDATSVALTPTNNSGLPTTGSLEVSPTTTTTYTLTATGPGGTTSASVTVTVTSATQNTARVSSGLVAYYPFIDGSGTIVTDHAPTGSPMPLALQGNVTWNGAENGVVFHGGWIGTLEPATKVINALMASHKSTFELWVVPAQASQKGPAHILSLGNTLNSFNFLLSHSYTSLDIRLLHTRKGDLAKPRLYTNDKVMSTTLRHIVHTYDGTMERLYINGVLQPATVVASGVYTNWHATAALNLGNEPAQTLKWLGTIRLLAIYDRALTQTEVQQNFTAGPTGN